MTARTRSRDRSLSAVVVRVLARAGWTLIVSRHEIALIPRARRSCPECHGRGGWWVGGPFPEMEACDCTDRRREYCLPLRRRPGVPDESPF